MIPRAELRRSLASVLVGFEASAYPDLSSLGQTSWPPSRDRLDDLKEKRSRDEDEKAEIDYGNAYTAIFKPTSEKQVRRYIRLFKGPEIVRRTNLAYPVYTHTH